jgi:pyrroline-5-carboxylate reductase
MSSSSSSHAIDASAALADLSEIWIGFIGCGKISSAVAEGYATAPEPHRPRRIIVSQRSVEKSKELKQKFPQLVEVAESTEDIIGAADVIFIGLLPTVARQLLPTLTFRPKTIIVSMMAVMDIDEVVSLVRVKRSQVLTYVFTPRVSICTN